MRDCRTLAGNESFRTVGVIHAAGSVNRVLAGIARFTGFVSPSGAVTLVVKSGALATAVVVSVDIELTVQRNVVLRIDRTVRAQRGILRDFHLQHARGTGRGDGKRRQLIYRIPCRRHAAQGAIRNPQLTYRHLAAAVPANLRPGMNRGAIGGSVGVVRSGCSVRLGSDAHPFVIHCAQVWRVGGRRIFGY